MFFFFYKCEFCVTLPPQTQVVRRTKLRLPNLLPFIGAPACGTGDGVNLVIRVRGAVEP